MAAVVCVHGIGKQYSGEQDQHGHWAGPLNDGLRRAGAAPLAADDVACAFYGHLFRPPGRRLAPQDPPAEVAGLDEFEAELLLAWWAEAARTDDGVVGPESRTLAATPRLLQRALNALSGSRFFAGVVDRALVADLRQVRRYFTEPEIRAAAQREVVAAVGPDTRVLVGHSLGSVVAYESLAAHPEWPIAAFVTLGSPLGIRNLIYDRLVPGGAWPGGAGSWTNVVDEGDVVALVKDLRPGFGPDVVGYAVENGSHAHDVRRYLTTPEVGEAVADGLRAG